MSKSIVSEETIQVDKENKISLIERLLKGTITLLMVGLVAYILLLMLLIIV